MQALHVAVVKIAYFIVAEVQDAIKDLSKIMVQLPFPI